MKSLSSSEAIRLKGSLKNGKNVEEGTEELGVMRGVEECSDILEIII